MVSSHAKAIASAPILSDADFEVIRRLAYDHFGLDLGAGKHALVAARLGKVLRQLGLPSFRTYCDLVRSDHTGAALASMADHLTTNHTSFFREPRHFDFLRKIISPLLKSRPRVDIWCAGCSTGEEPYSVAMTLLDEAGADASARVRIKASDISTRVLDKAKTATYAPDRFQTIPIALRQRFLGRSPRDEDNSLRFTSEVRSMVDFERLNLIQPLPAAYRCSVLFCRNVMIYFDRPTQQRLVERLAQQIEEGGYLFVGHSESLSSISHSFEYISPAIYRKPSSAPPAQIGRA